ncbi:hypothetical protein G4L39_13615, partial [Limisphaera ngatamarikiensis]|nr:hypothetical protein [Limisphaera ngatamarikiensis]
RRGFGVGDGDGPQPGVGNPDRLQGEVRSAVVVQTPELLVHDLDGNLV